MFEAGPNQTPDGAGLSVEPPRASELSKRINALLSSLRSSRSTYASCYVVKQGKLHSCDVVCDQLSSMQSAKMVKTASLQEPMSHLSCSVHMQRCCMSGAICCASS